MTPDERAAIRAEAFKEAAEIAREDARAISKGTFGRLGSIEAIGRHIAEAIEARAKEKQP